MKKKEKTVEIEGKTFIDNRPGYPTDKDDEFKTLMMQGFPLPENERIGMPPMIASYWNIDTSRYPHRITWTGANSHNDEVLENFRLGAEIHRAYCAECRAKYEKEQNVPIHSSPTETGQGKTDGELIAETN